jgi:hypothetical protein
MHLQELQLHSQQETPLPAELEMEMTRDFGA